MTAEEIRPWVSLFWTALGPTVILPLLAGLLVKGYAWLQAHVLGQQVQNATADAAKMESELQAALGRGFDAAATSIAAHGLTSDAARTAILTAATAYFQQRFPDRTAQIDASTPAAIAPAMAVAETLASRLGNIVAATIQKAEQAPPPAPQGTQP